MMGGWAGRVEVLEAFLANDLQVVITYDLPRWGTVAEERLTEDGGLPFTISRGVLFASNASEAEAASRFPDADWAPHAALRRDFGRMLRHRIGADLGELGLTGLSHPPRHIAWWVAGALAGPPLMVAADAVLGLDLDLPQSLVGLVLGGSAASTITERRDTRRLARREAAWGAYAQWRAARLIVDAAQLDDVIAAVESAMRAVKAFDALGHGTADIRARIGAQVDRGVRALGEAQRLLAVSTEDYALLALLERDEIDAEARALRAAARGRSAELRGERATAAEAVAAIEAIGASLEAEARRHRALLKVTERNRLLGESG